MRRAAPVMTSSTWPPSAWAGDPPGEAPAHRDPNALAYFFLQAGGHGRDQLPGRIIQ
jgi:hypothetical protein